MSEPRVRSRKRDGYLWGSHYPNYLRAARFLIASVKEIQPMNTNIIVEE